MSQGGTIKSPSVEGTPAVPTSFTADSGTAIPTGNNLEVLGGTNIATTGSGKVLTLSLDGTIAATNGGTGQSSYSIGDLLYADTSTSLATLSAGADGEVLTLASGVPSWATASGGGQWELISTSTPSGASTVEFTDLAQGEIYRISFENVVASDTSARLAIRCSNDNGSSFSSSADYNWAVYSLYSSASPGSDQEDTYMALISIIATADMSDGRGLYGNLYLSRISETSQPMQIESDMNYFTVGGGGNTVPVRVLGHGASRSGLTIGNTLFDVDAIQFLFIDSETITGTMKLYKSTE